MAPGYNTVNSVGLRLRQPGIRVVRATIFHCRWESITGNLQPFGSMRLPLSPAVPADGLAVRVAGPMMHESLLGLLFAQS